MNLRRRGRNQRRPGGEDQQPAVPAPPARPSALSGEAPPFVVIDALGRKCPIPIIMLAERIHEVPLGRTVAVMADDAAARTDIPAWCRMKSQDFVREETLQSGWAFHIRRAY